MAPPESLRSLRIDKWLWAARFYKTRSLATAAIHAGHIKLNGNTLKPARELHPGDTLEITIGETRWAIVVRQLNEQRRPASEAQLLYEETAESLRARQLAAERRRYAPEPALSISHGRPTKHDRRAMDDHKQDAAHAWDDRWSASIDE